MLQKFLKDRRGSTTIEFVVVFLGFIAVLLFVVEVALYQFFTATLEKAANAGVRAAIVSDSMVSGLPSRNFRAIGGVYGERCSSAGAPCQGFSTITCTGSECEAAPFTRILAHMRGFNGRIAAENITVSYADVGIGFAGGPVAPMVTVTVSNVPYQTGVVGLLLQNAGVLSVLPTRSASMTGEDLAQ